jgi:hypothetical protein
MWSFSTIFAPVRKQTFKFKYIGTALSCSVCSAFWLGVLTSFFYNPIILDVHIFLLPTIICGLVTHLFASILYKLLFPVP